MLLTPVLLGNSNLGESYEPTKVSYKSGDRLSALVPPTPQLANSGGLIIRMPLEQPRSYLERMLTLKALSTDEVLVQNLNQVLDRVRCSKVYLPPSERVELQLKESGFLQHFDAPTQQAMIARARSTATEESKTNAGKRELHNEQQLDEFKKLANSSDERQAVEAWICFRVASARCKLQKREIKRLEKEALTVRKSLNGVKRS